MKKNMDMDMKHIASAMAALFDDAMRLNSAAGLIVLACPTDNPELGEATESLCRTLDGLGPHLRALGELMGLPEYCRRRDIAELTEAAALSLVKKPAPCKGRES